MDTRYKTLPCRHLQFSRKYLLQAAVFPGRISAQEQLLPELVFPGCLLLEFPRVKHSFIPRATGMAISILTNYSNKPIMDLVATK